MKKERKKERNKDKIQVNKERIWVLSEVWHLDIGGGMKTPVTFAVYKIFFCIHWHTAAQQPFPWIQ